MNGNCNSYKNGLKKNVESKKDNASGQLEKYKNGLKKNVELEKKNV